MPIRLKKNMCLPVGNYMMILYTLHQKKLYWRSLRKEKPVVIPVVEWRLTSRGIYLSPSVITRRIRQQELLRWMKDPDVKVSMISVAQAIPMIFAEKYFAFIPRMTDHIRFRMA